MPPDRTSRSEFDQWYDSLTDTERHEVNRYLRAIATERGVDIQHKKLLAFYEQAFVPQEDLLHVSTGSGAMLSLN